MPPRKNGNGASSEGSDGAAAAVTALCHLIMSCDDFKADNIKLASILGIAQAKNVLRKINSIVNPYGFEFKSGKILQRAGAAAINDHGHGGEGNAEPASGGAAVTEGGGSGSGGGEAAVDGDIDQKETKSGQGRQHGATSKKRKVASSSEDGKM